MLTLCWAAKGGSGTTTVAAAIALVETHPTLLVDLDGDAATAVGVTTSPGSPTLADWFRSGAPADRLAYLEQPISSNVSIIATDGRIDRLAPIERWEALASALRRDDRIVVVDAGTGAPPPALIAAADRSLLVTRACYLALLRAQRLGVRPSGIVLIDEPGRSLRPADLERSLGAPIVATLQLDPKIARAIDSGLAVSRLPAGCAVELRAAA